MTLYIVIVTAIISIIALYRHSFFSRLQLNTFQTYHSKEYYRLFSHSLVHADWVHLIVNMFVLYSFGQNVEAYFSYFQSAGLLKFPALYYIFFYVTAVVVASLSTLKKHKDDPMYNSVGASGGVSAIVFASIFFDPWHKLYFYGIVPVPGIVFGGIYLFYSWYMSRRNVGYINHDAHYWGAVYGLVFPIFIDHSLFLNFLQKLISFQ